MTSPNVIAPFAPFEWQIAPWRDKSPVILLTGSKNGGKSHLAAEKLHGFMLAYPGACGLALRKAREWCKGSVKPMLEYAIGNDPHVHVKDDKIDYDNGSRIYFGGLKDKEQREALRSMRGNVGEPDIAWLEEANAFTRDDFEEVNGNTRGHAADWTQLILTTNPDYPQHWIYTDLIVSGQARVYYSGIKDNPRASAADFDRLERYTGSLRERLKEGKWVRAEGVVYDEYDPAIHLIDAFPIPVTWRRKRAVDFGYTNPFVCQWWAIDPDGIMYLYRELVKTKALVQDLTPQILTLSSTVLFQRNQPDGTTKDVTENDLIEATIADHDAEDRATMQNGGVPTTAARKDVQLGIQAVKARLKVQPNGKARMYILRGSLVEYDDEYSGPQGLENEIPAYSWQPAVEGKAAKEEPVKMFDHSCDPARYVVMSEEGPSAAGLMGFG